MDDKCSRCGCDVPPLQAWCDPCHAIVKVEAAAREEAGKHVGGESLPGGECDGPGERHGVFREDTNDKGHRIIRKGETMS